MIDAPLGTIPKERITNEYSHNVEIINEKTLFCTKGRTADEATQSICQVDIPKITEQTAAGMILCDIHVSHRSIDLEL